MNGRKDKKLMGQAAARNAGIINLLAAPGLGSLMAGRIVAGLGQIILALAGFALVIIWFIQLMIQYYGMIGGQESTYQPHSWLGISGAIVFVVAWLWSLVTSIGLVREARRGKDAPDQDKQEVA